MCRTQTYCLLTRKIREIMKMGMNLWCTICMATGNKKVKNRRNFWICKGLSIDKTPLPFYSTFSWIRLIILCISSIGHFVPDISCKSCQHGVFRSWRSNESRCRQGRVKTAETGWGNGERWAGESLVGVQELPGPDHLQQRGVAQEAHALRTFPPGQLSDLTQSD